MIETFVESFESGSLSSYFKCFVSSARKLSLQGRRSGGLICLVSNLISSWVDHVRCNFDNILVFRFHRQLFNSEKDVLVICTYIPPMGSPYYASSGESNGVSLLEECLLQLYTEHADCSLLICGDFNARTGNSNAASHDSYLDMRIDVLNEFRQSQDSITNDFGRSLLSLCLGFDLQILNGAVDGDRDGCYTYISTTGNSVIDYFLVSCDFLPYCTYMFLRENIQTMHLCLELSVKGNVAGTTDRKAHVITKLVWDARLSEMYTNQLQANFDKLDNEIIVTTEENEIDVICEDVTRCFVEAAKCTRKRVTYRMIRYSQPWFDIECQIAKSKLRSLLRLYRRTLITSIKLEYNRHRNLYKRLLGIKKLQYREAVTSRLLENIHDPAKFWMQIKQFSGRKYLDSRIPVDTWFEHFRKVFQTVNSVNVSDIEEIPHDFSEDELSFLNSDISEDEINTAIAKLKGGRAAGLDEILAEMLKCATRPAVSWLHRLFNKVFKQGKFPSAWSKSIIVPIHKKGDPTNPDNYRGICLSSIFCKVFTSIVTARLQSWAETNNLIVEEQAGFRAGYSTVDNMFILQGIIQRYLSRKRKLYTAFVDFKKAFDTVDRDALWKVLEMYGMKGRMLNLIKGMYSSVWYCVKHNGQCTGTFECNRGLKQGCKTSPIIFSLLISYVAKMVIRNGKHGVQLMPDFVDIYLLMFADDVVLISDTVIGLQNQLDVLLRESCKLGLTVNTAKTKIVVFRNGGFLAEHEKWCLGEERLEVVNEYKYLGAVFSTRLSYRILQTDLVQRARAGMLQTIKCYRKLGCTSPNFLYKLFDAQVGPVLFYSSEIWGTKDCSLIEKVHTQALKRFLHLPSRTPNVIVYGETGRYPLNITAKIRSIKYWLRILRMEPSRYPRKVYDMMLCSGNNTWARDIQDLLCRHGFEDVWNLQFVPNEVQFLRDLKNYLINEYVNDWSTAIANSDRYAFYRRFKNVFTREPYLYVIDKQIFRDAMIRFRAGVSPLYVHRHRYSNDAPDSFICPSCKEEDEDEEHFLFRCPAYEEVRKRFIFRVFDPMYHIDVDDILASDKVDTIRSASMYLFHAFRHRQDAMNTTNELCIC